MTAWRPTYPSVPGAGTSFSALLRHCGARRWPPDRTSRQCHCWEDGPIADGRLSYDDERSASGRIMCRLESRYHQPPASCGLL